MRELTEKELSTLKRRSAGLITKEELEKEINFRASYSEMKYYLDSFMTSKDYHNFEAVLWDMPNQLTKEEEGKLYQKYLITQDHFQHSSIVTAFQTYFNDDSTNIPVLIQAITNIPSYLEGEDIKYPYIKKIIYSIGAQPEPYNFEALEKLSNETKDDRIRDLGLHQIEKRKKLGRWEFMKNRESEF
ncbi:hypothetical protein GCM10011506_44300 [Marivirga lumbricoides]|uniref:Uncharacterized protein n=1 Tax=Marivirga lumbricoides TaxID=1046115 RepID=A0ABQ1N5B8_9BACT|nr:hypothetical protein GCM10011506_44300 [Marivirga lumbricoides]